jgi:hypothetical protein
MKWLFRISWLYLLLPFILFGVGWLRLAIAVPVIGVMLWALWGIWNRVERAEDEFQPRITAFVILLAGLWVLLSGVGGYAFQNYDFHARNAILRDLIEYEWPVIYAQPERGPLRMLVYYLGYWLPAALAGKLLGWNFANGFLFLWTWLGVILVILHLGSILRTSAVNAALLLIGFSGLDALGTILFAHEYPSLWPPLQHLEIWAGILQYSSFTTQLFWVFNQALPAWLCILLLMRKQGSDASFLAWASCVFFAPLVSVGLLPYLALDWFTQVRREKSLRGMQKKLILAGVLVLLISFIYFSSNSAAQDRGWQMPAWSEALKFILLEAGVFWLLLAPLRRREPAWIVTGLLLLCAPFIQLGGGRDFVMRASIAPLMVLMIWCGTAVLDRDAPRWIRASLLVALAIGSLSPLYEINRSLYRSVEYYFLLDQDQRLLPDREPAVHLEQGGAPEAEHPGALLADEIYTLAFLDDQLSDNYIANVRRSLYERYLSPR